MTLKIAERGVIPPFIVMDVMSAANERAASGKDVLHLEVGQPSTSAPKAVLEAAKQVLETDLLGYTDALGVPPLRERLASYYQDYYGITVPMERIIVTTGSSGAFMLSFLASFDHGDKVGLATPSYPAYKNILRALGVEIIDIPVGPDTAFQPTAEILADLGVQLDGLIVASPSNPTGSMLSAEALEDNVQWCDANSVRLISDEIYHGITYGGKASTALSFGDNAIIVNSFSKYFSMTGWRLGYASCRPILRPVIEEMTKIQQYTFVCAPTPFQQAAVAAMDYDISPLVDTYKEKRDLLCSELAQTFDIAKPAGAFYAFVPAPVSSSTAFVERAIKSKCLVIPGNVFSERDSHFRISYATANSEIQRGCGILRKLGNEDL